VYKLRFYASGFYAATEASCFCLARSARILNEFRLNLQEVITAPNNRSNDYILGEIGAGIMEQNTTEDSNRRQSVLPRCQTDADA